MLLIDAQDRIFGLDQGPEGHGRIFKADAAGNVETLLAFADLSSGLPQRPSTLILGDDGWLYGTVAVQRGYPYAHASIGSPSTAADTPTGFLFRVHPDNAATYQTLRSFTLAEGEFAWGSSTTSSTSLPFVPSSLAEGPDGYLYGGLGAGTCATTRRDRTELRTIVAGSPLCGGDPKGGLSANASGLILSGTPIGDDLRDYYDGPNLHGSLYRIRKDGTDFKVLHTFSGTDGSQPRGAIALAADGRLYGTTVGGGINRSDNRLYTSGGAAFPRLEAELSYDGTMYRIDPQAVSAGDNGFEHLYNFKGGVASSSDSFGRTPIGLAAAPNGRLYGGTYAGGLPTRAGYLSNNGGTLYEVRLDGVDADAMVTLTLTPTTTVQEGESVTAAWSSRGVARCTANGGSSSDGWAGEREAQGEYSFVPAQLGTFTYSLTCKDDSGSVQAGSNLVQLFVRVPAEAETDYELNQGNGGGALASGALAALAALGAAVGWRRHRNRGNSSKSQRGTQS